jgi:hypothetical protein
MCFYGKVVFSLFSRFALTHLQNRNALWEDGHFGDSLDDSLGGHFDGHVGDSLDGHFGGHFGERFFSFLFGC